MRDAAAAQRRKDDIKMKYKALVTGKNNSIIDDFFVHMDTNFEVMSTSTRFGDIIRHIKYFDPDVFIYCLSGETPDNLRQMNSIKHNLAPTRIPFVLVGSKEECDEFEKFAVNVANMILVKPFTANSIQEKILNFLDERQEYVQAYRNRTDEPDDLNDKNNKKEKKKAVMTADIDSLKNTLSSLEAALSSPVNTPESNQNIDSGETVESETAERKHILVVDDDPVMLKVLKEQLHDEYDVATAINGKIALKFLERKKTDLILLDYEMPEESGPVVMEKIRANDSIKDIPIVFLTGVSEREKITEALALKPQSYLLKPVDREKLMKVITDIIG